MDRCLIFRPVLTGILYISSGLAFAQSSIPASVRFQGRLTNAAGQPVPNTATQRLAFRLYTEPTGGIPLWSQTLTNVVVQNGVFTVNLDLSAGYSGTNTLDSVLAAKPYLEVVAGTDPPMIPRLPLTSSAYALRARTVESIPSTALNGSAWLLGGNSGASPASQFIGTRDNQPLAVRVNNRRALLMEDRTDPGNTFHTVNIVAGAASNAVGAGVFGTTIAGGGQDNNSGLDIGNLANGSYGVIGGGSGNFIDAFVHATIAGGSGNVVQGDFATVGGGQSNNPSGNHSTIAGGKGHSIAGIASTIGGGASNSINGHFATVAGGDGNVSIASASTIGGGQSNASSGAYAAIGGGFQNQNLAQYGTIGGGAQNEASGFLATIAGGSQNDVRGQYAMVGGGSRNAANADTATISGGDQNTVNGTFTSIGGGRLNYGWSVSDFSVIGGGFSNTVYGDFASIPGGYKNSTDGLASLAAGYRAYAAHDGSFVWSDAHEADFVSSAPNQFCVRATGGLVLEAFGNFPFFTGVGTGEANRFVLLLNSPRAPSASGLKAGGILCSDSFDYASPAKNNMVVKGTLGVGYPDPAPYVFAVNGTTYSHGGYSSSDARWKTNIQPLDRPLSSVLRLRGVTFDWRTDEFRELKLQNGRQIGLIAQDVEQVLPEVVSSDVRGYKAVSYQSLVPVLIEAIKEQQEEIQALQEEVAEARANAVQVNELEARLRALEQAIRPSKR